MKNKNYKATYEFAEYLDSVDPLKDYRQEFYLPKDKIYMDGNSLGLLSKSSEDAVRKAMDDWKQLAINGWLDADSPWFYLAEEVGRMIAPLFGATENEIIATGGTTINIHSLLATFYQPKGKRKKILMDELNFPSDIYAVKGFIEIKGGIPEKDLVLIQSNDGLTLNTNEIISHLNDEIALLILPSVLYRSGQLLDINRITKEAHKKNVIVGFDCSHSAGIIPHELHEEEVDFAFWCGYKYLNGGPGSTGFLFIHEKHFNKKPYLSGWFGYKKDRQFEMALDFDYERNAGGWQISTPNILSLMSIKGAMDIHLKAGIKELRKKSILLTEFFIFLMEHELTKPPYNYKIASPGNPEERSGHVAISHDKYAWQINSALKHYGVIPDFRKPNIIRIAPMALYNSFKEVYKVYELLKKIIDQKHYLDFSEEISSVS